MIDEREPLRALHARAEKAARAVRARVFRYQPKTEKQQKIQEEYKEDLRHINAFLNTAEIYLNTPIEMVYVVAKPQPTEKHEPRAIQQLFDDACKRRRDEWLREENRERRRAESIANARQVWEHLY